MDEILKVENLTKSYPGFKLDNISFSVQKGVIIGIIGENGAGKSTIIKAVLDIIQKDSGEITFWGQKLSENKKLKEDIAVVFDEINFYEKLTPVKVGKILKTAYNQWDDDTYNHYIKKFKIPSDKEIKTFSKGMKMKFSIAAALSHNPKLLILDEATGGLDPIVRDDILEIFLDFVQDESHSIIISSHITSDLEKIADYIMFVHKGKLMFLKSKDELRYNYGIIRCGAETFNKINRDEVVAYKKDDYQYNILVADKEKAKIKYKNEIIDDASIEEILLFYVKGEKRE